MPEMLKASEMLGSPLGSFVYHLLLLLALEAAFGMALAEWRSTRQEQARHILMATAGLTVVRLIYVAAALISLAGWFSPATLLPPLERAIDTASLCLLGWAFVRPGDRWARAWNSLFGANLVLAVAAGVVFAVLWSGARAGNSALDYTRFWQSTVWYGWQIALALTAGLMAVRSLGEGSSAFLVAMLFFFVGALLQLTHPAAEANLPFWARLANLVAYPLVAMAVYQSIVAGLRAQVRQLQEIGQASLDQVKSLLLLVDASRQISGSLNLSTVLENAAQGVARALDADQCGIALPEEADPNYMRLVAVHNSGRQGRGEAATFPLEYQLAVQQAVRRKRYVTVEDQDNVQLKVLFTLLGSSESGPALVQPLLLNGDVIGVLIVGNSRSRRSFTPNEAKLSQAMAEQVVVALQNAERYKAAQDRIKELHRAQGEKRPGAPQPKAVAREMPNGLVSSPLGPALERGEELEIPGSSGMILSG